MAVPSDLLQAIMDAAAQDAAMQAPPDQAEVGGLYGATGGDNVEALRIAIDALQQYAQEEDDDLHIQTVLKCITALQGILANEQKMEDNLLAGRVDPRALRRASLRDLS